MIFHIKSNYIELLNIIFKKIIYHLPYMKRYLYTIIFFNKNINKIMNQYKIINSIKIIDKLNYKIIKVNTDNKIIYII